MQQKNHIKMIRVGSTKNKGKIVIKLFDLLNIAIRSEMIFFFFKKKRPECSVHLFN